MADGPRPVIVPPGDGTTIEGPVGGPLTFKVRGGETGGSLTAFENVIPPGEGPPMHVHAGEDESWYVLEGDLRFSLGGELHTVRMERFFERFAALPEGRFDPESFRTAGAEAGMDVVGPPLAISHPV